MELFLAVMEAGIRVGAPLAIAALGEAFVQRAGLINIGLEGIMLSGAFFGFLLCYTTGSPEAGLLLAATAGVLMAAVFAVSTIRFQADQIVAGTALNLIALGLTGTLYSTLFGRTGSALSVNKFEALPLPLLSEIPVLGDLFFNHNILVYATVPLTVLLWVWLTRTRKGIELVALGEHPRAADAVGVRVNVQRFGYVLFGGMLGGLAGGYLSLAHANTFTQEMSGGRGFIAIAIVILGKWKPGWILLAALFFGMAEGAQFAFQAAGWAIPHQFLLMLPYVLTIAVLAGFIGGARAPAALGRPYVRE